MLGTERVEHEVEAPTATAEDAPDLGGEVGGAVVDRMLYAVAADRLVLARRGGAEYLGAGVAGQLGRGDAHPAAGGVDEHPVALAQPAEDVQGPVRRGVVDHERRALLEAQPIRQRQHVVSGTATISAWPPNRVPAITRWPTCTPVTAGPTASTTPDTS